MSENNRVSLCRRRRFSMPALTFNQEAEFSSKKSPVCPKIKISDGLFLSDHTVSFGDPRIVDALESANRIRKRTGFDPTLLKDRVWAKKVCKDLAQGLARVDEIVATKRKRELCHVRNIEAERILLNRRMQQLSKNRIITGNHRCRSRSLEDFHPRLASAYKDLHRSVNNLKLYGLQLENQGGFFVNFSMEDHQIDESNCLKINIKETPALESKQLASEATSFPKLSDTPSFQDANEQSKILTINRHLITQPERTDMIMQVPSLPSIQVAIETNDLMLRSVSSLPYRMNRLMRDDF